MRLKPERIPDQISVQELCEKMAQEAPFLLLDVREKWEYDLCRLPRSRHIPCREVVNHADTFSRSQEIVVLCHHGQRSMRICCLLQQLGFDRVQNLQGGIDAWARHIDPEMPSY